MKEDYHKWYNHHLNREFEMLVFGHFGIPLIIFPTARSKYFEAKDMGLISALTNFIEDGKLKVYCPDSYDANSWFNYDIPPQQRAANHIEYENLIINDVLEFARHETESEKVSVAGCAFGAYHAANLAFKHPDKIGSLICLSGIFDIRNHIYGYYDDNCYFNNPPDYLPSLSDSWYINSFKEMKIILGTGENDPSLEANKSLSFMLNRKGVENWLDIWERAESDWSWWRQMFPNYIAKIL